eukprot:37449-Eustigmatos_ZCMA.PRE.1
MRTRRVAQPVPDFYRFYVGRRHSARVDTRTCVACLQLDVHMAAHALRGVSTTIVTKPFSPDMTIACGMWSCSPRPHAPAGAAAVLLAAAGVGGDAIRPSHAFRGDTVGKGPSARGRDRKAPP